MNQIRKDSTVMGGWSTKVRYHYQFGTIGTRHGLYWGLIAMPEDLNHAIPKILFRFKVPECMESWKIFQVKRLLR